MKILRAEQIRELDQLTIENEPIASIELMERAALACTGFLDFHFPDEDFLIVAGNGNNGGDGLAIARQLDDLNRSCTVIVSGRASKGTADFRTNLERLKLHPQVEVLHVEDLTELPNPGEHTILIDALFGTGLNRAVEGKAAELIDWMNSCRTTRISIDIPSGLAAEPDQFEGPIVIADHTLSFEMPKRSFLLDKESWRTGQIELLQIGLDREAWTNMPGSEYYLTTTEAAGIRKKRRVNAHKGDFGHALLIAGSKGKAGAAVLSAKACLRTGAGLLSCAVPESVSSILHAAVPEAMSLPGVGDEVLERSPEAEHSVIAIGPGLGTSPKSAEAISDTLKRSDCPVVLDADGLNLLATHPEWYELLKGRAILTPHPGELERLCNCGKGALDQYRAGIKLAAEKDVIVILKGAHTRILLPDGTTWFNSSGNPGMATAGTGDVLCGMVAGLISSGYSLREAALLGVHLHGLAGDIYADEFAEESLNAGDLVSLIGDAWSLLD